MYRRTWEVILLVSGEWGLLEGLIKTYQDEGWIAQAIVTCSEGLVVYFSNADPADAESVACWHYVELETRGIVADRVRYLGDLSEDGCHFVSVRVLSTPEGDRWLHLMRYPKK